ncbi:helix-turn-helix domain-containing protein [Leisingera aquimarina]
MLSVNRRWALRDQMSIREIARRTGLEPPRVFRRLHLLIRMKPQ